MILTEIVFNSAILLVIFLLFFENRPLARNKITIIIFDMIFFIGQVIMKTSIGYWGFIRSIFEILQATIFFLPKILKLLILFHYLFNFIMRLYVFILVISISYEILKYIKYNQTMKFNHDLVVILKYFAVFLMFMNFEMNNATIYSALMFIVDLIKINIQRNFKKRYC